MCWNMMKVSKIILLFSYFFQSTFLSLSGKSVMSSIPFIQLVIVINLDRRPNRLKHMERQLKQLQIPFHRFPAIDFQNGTNITKLIEIRKKLHPLTQMNLTLVMEELTHSQHHSKNWASTGCWQSHLQIYLHIVKGKYSSSASSSLPPLPQKSKGIVAAGGSGSNNRSRNDRNGGGGGGGPYLILEDDLIISPKIKEILHQNYLMNFLPKNWEIFFLDHFLMKCHDEKLTPPHPSNQVEEEEEEEKGEGEGEGMKEGVSAPNLGKNLTQRWSKRNDDHTKDYPYCLVASTYRTSAYVIRNKEVIKKLIAKSNTKQLQIADIYFNQLFFKKEIYAYALIHPIIRQNQAKFGSDVQYSDGSKKDTKKSPSGSLQV